MARRVFVLGVLCAAALAQDPEDLADRVRRLERELTDERARGKQREQRLRELEIALEKATDALARAQDRRGLEAEIEEFLNERAPAAPLVDGASSRLNIGGVIVTSFRYTDLSGSTNPRSNTFQVEERYLRFVYRFADQVTARYYTDGSLAELEYHRSDLFQVNAGLVVVPFGQFNPRSFPDTFDTLSRPLLYLGDEDTFATPLNNPRAVFRSIYSDTGVVVSGNRWRDGDQLYYAVFVTNGLVGVNDLAGGSGFSDNNDNKQLGARVTYTIASWFDNARLGFGVSWMTGKYDTQNSLSYRMYGADFVYVLEGLFASGEGSVTVRAEYVFAPREIRAGTVGDPTTLIEDANRTQGAYVLVEVRTSRRWMVYVQVDWLSQRAPLLSAEGLLDPADLRDPASHNYRYAIGVVRKFRIGLVWKTEYAYWEFDLGAPNAHRFSTQLVIPF